MRTLIFIVCNCLAVTNYADSSPRRRTGHGEILGAYWPEESQPLAELYQCIPYAEPPIGQLRFEPPMSTAKKSFDTLDARREMPWCVQFWYKNPVLEDRNGTEDCLYLRMLVPMGKAKHKHGWPVLVWIHGGSYQVSGANIFPTKGTVDSLVSKGIIVVFVNYRLGPLGFLSTESPVLAGNLGLLDQIAALEWVKENVKSFGGDENRVTLAGESAGASSVSLLALSRRARGLFSRIILRSGSSLSPWAVRTLNTQLNSAKLIQSMQIGCGSYFRQREFERMKDCLKQVPLENFTQAWRSYGKADVDYVIAGRIPSFTNHPFMAHTYFTPVVDGHVTSGRDAVIQYEPMNMLKEKASLPALISVTTAECAAYITWLHFLANQSELRVDLFNLDLVVPSQLYHNSEEIRSAVRQNYHVDSDELHAKRLVQIASDQSFVTPAVQEATYYALSHIPVYTGIFDHRNGQLDAAFEEFGVKNVGAAHGYDMVYLFHSTGVINPKEFEINWSSSDLKISSELANTVVSFVLKGRPSASIGWPQYTVSDRRALRQRTNASRLAPFFPDQFHFWSKTVPIIENLQLDQFDVGRCPNNKSKEEKLLKLWRIFAALVLIFLVVAVGVALAAWICYYRPYRHWLDGVSCSTTPLAADEIEPTRGPTNNKEQTPIT